MSSDQSPESAHDESASGRSAPADSAKEFVLADCDLGDLGEELRAVLEKRVARCESLGESATARLYREAFDLARKALEEVCCRPEERS